MSKEKVTSEFYSEKSAEFTRNIVVSTETRNQTRDEIKDYKESLKELKKQLRELEHQINECETEIVTRRGTVRHLNHDIWKNKRLSKKISRDFTNGKEVNTKRYTK